MFYRVRARLREDTAAELRRKLLDGTIAAQKPDGNEIVASMERAVVTVAGDVVWSEVCYCSSPLGHERETVYDHHFDGLTTEQIDGYETFDGLPFMDHLAMLAQDDENGSS